MSSINHETYHTRLSQLTRLIQHLHLPSPSTITPLAYQELGPCPYNNFLYKLTFSEPVTVSLSHPITTPSPPPPPTNEYIIRLSNPLAMGINPLANRIENEIAAMQLARMGLDTVRQGLGGVSTEGVCVLCEARDGGGLAVGGDGG